MSTSLSISTLISAFHNCKHLLELYQSEFTWVIAQIRVFVFLFFHFKIVLENVHHKINIYVNGFSPFRTSQVNHLKLKIHSLTSITMLHILNLYSIIIHKHYFSQFTRVIVLLISSCTCETAIYVRSGSVHFNSWRVLSSRLVTRVLRDIERDMCITRCAFDH